MKTLLASFLLAVTTQAESFQIAPAANTRFALTVEKTGLMRGKKHLFLFEKYQGQLEFDPKAPENSRIDLTIDSRSFVCKDDWVDAGDLKKIEKTALDDMLAVNRYPSMTFRSTAIKALPSNRYEAQGTLTIRGIAKPVVVAVTLDLSNPASLKLDGSATIKLSDYNLKPPSAILGTIGTKNEMTLNFSIVATRSN
ncbi:MAG: YceI family protein [Acidobacteriota bacterium]